MSLFPQDPDQGKLAIAYMMSKGFEKAGEAVSEAENMGAHAVTGFHPKMEPDYAGSVNDTDEVKTTDDRTEGGENMDLGERSMRPGDAVDTVFKPLEMAGRNNYDDSDARYQDVLSQTGDEAEAYRVLGASDVLEQDLSNGSPAVNPEQAGMFVAVSPYGELAVDQKIDQYLDEQGMEDAADYVETELIGSADDAWNMMAQLGLDQAQIKELSTKVDTAVDALETVTRTVYAFPDSDDVEAVVDGVQDARQEGREAEEHYDDFVEDFADEFL